jgi:hypothetical protein
MCSTGFSYVLIGKDDERMIVCRNEDYDLSKIQEAIREAFPELKTGAFKKLFPGEVPTKVEGCRKMYSSQFDCQVIRWEERHDWKKNPFVALQVIKKEGKTYCGAKKCETGSQ